MSMETKKTKNAAEIIGKQSGAHSDKRCRKRTTTAGKKDFNTPWHSLEKAVHLAGFRSGDVRAELYFYYRFKRFVQIYARRCMREGNLDILTIDDVEQHLWVALCKGFKLLPIKNLATTQKWAETILENACRNLIKYHTLRQQTELPWDSSCVIYDLKRGDKEKYGSVDIVQASPPEEGNNKFLPGFAVLAPQDRNPEGFAITFHVQEFLRKAPPDIAYVLRAIMLDKTGEEIAREKGWSLPKFNRKKSQAFASLKTYMLSIGYGEADRG